MDQVHICDVIAVAPPGDSVVLTTAGLIKVLSVGTKTATEVLVLRVCTYTRPMVNTSRLHTGK